MRTATVAAFLALAVPAFPATPQVPRPAKELTIVEPSGKQTLLSSYKGKVCVIQFLYTTCPHCQELSKVLTKIGNDLNPQGFQAIGIAFDEATPAKAANYVRQFNLGFPVGYASRETVLGYLEISVMDRFVVPQTVVVDRKGVVRAQSLPMGTIELQQEASLRTLIGGLLKESASAPAVSAKKPAPKADSKAPKS